MMSSALVLSLALSVTAGNAPLLAQADAKKIRVMVLEPTAVNAGDKSIATAVAGLIPVELAPVQSFDVLAAADVKQMVEFEAEKEAVGCSDNSCLAELAGALGADLVIFGDVSRLGKLIIVNINLFESVKTRAAGRISIQTRSIEELPTKLSDAMRTLVRPFLEANSLPVPTQWGTEVAASVAPSTDPGSSSTTSTASGAETTEGSGGQSEGLTGNADDGGGGIMMLLPWAVAGGGVAIAVVGGLGAAVTLGLPLISAEFIAKSAEGAVAEGDRPAYNFYAAIYSFVHLVFYVGTPLAAVVVLGGAGLGAVGVGWGALRLME